MQALSEAFDALFRAAAQEFGRDPRQVKRQAIVESGLRPDAVSHSGCVGLLQLAPATFAEWADRLRIPPPRAIADPTQNVRVSCAYMAWLEARFGSLPAALAAYNWGPGHLTALGTPLPSDWLGRVPAVTAQYVHVCLAYETLDVADSSSPPSVPTTAASAPHGAPMNPVTIQMALQIAAFLVPLVEHYGPSVLTLLEAVPEEIAALATKLAALPADHPALAALPPALTTLLGHARPPAAAAA